MIRHLSILFFLLFLTLNTTAQKASTSFIFGHSLIHHEFQVNPTPSQETSVPHWLHFLSIHAGHTFRVSGQYGFLPQHANVPPIAQWGFDFVEGAWNSDNETFSEANFDNVIITPGNFIQWQSPTENYPNESVSPLSATETIFSWCKAQEDGLNFYVYENWPDMAPFLNNNFPPTEAEWLAYNAYLTTDFHDWFSEYYELLVEGFPNSCVKFIPVGTLISQLLSAAPYTDIPYSELYEDNAPHGRASIYFLASLISYMAIYEEKAPLDYQVESIIHPVIAENYTSIVEEIWTNLLSLNFSNGDSSVFCNQPISNTAEGVEEQIHISLTPNPTTDFLTVESSLDKHYIDIFDTNGQALDLRRALSQDSERLDLTALTKGVYILIGTDDSNQILYSKTFGKH